MSFAMFAPFLTVVAVLAILGLGLMGLFKAFYHKVPQGTALIVNDMTAQPKVHFTGALVYPVIYKKELMRISLITMNVDRKGKEGLICKDNLRADISVAFYIRVNETAQDVLRVAKAIGAERASDKNAVDELFNAKFAEALKTVGKKMDFIELFENRQQFRDEIVKVIGNDLNGYVLEDVAIDHLEQTSKDLLDPNNILDAEGIRKITALTGTQNVITNQLEQDARLAITKKNVEAKEALLALERQQADAEARQKREIDTIRAREQAETVRVQEEERLKAENARLTTQEQLDIRDQNRQREVEVAEQNRQRAVAIEVERVARARQLEVVTTEREVRLQGVERDKVVEKGLMDVANITRERIVIDKTVAQEQERIKEVRAVAEADRNKQVTILEAEAVAQETLVRQVKKAEADEAAARHRAVEMTTLAQAELDAAAKQAEAKKVLAEGLRAEQAAPGLADAQVREAEAIVMEKEGVAEARVISAKAEAHLKQGSAEASVLEQNLLAKARGEEQNLLAKARGEEQMGLAKATATKAQGTAEAEIVQQKLLAEARGEEQMGLARATATKAQGSAEAEIVQQKLLAEAEGLSRKFEAIDALTPEARGHEEFRLQLETALQQALAAIDAGKDVARENAEVLSAALRNAKIDIVGGEGAFFDNFSRSLSLGKSIEGFAGKSPIVQDLLTRYLGVPKPEPRVDSKALTGAHASHDSVEPIA